MKMTKAQLSLSRPRTALLEASRAVQGRLIRPDGVLSVDGLDAVTRALGVAIVVVLSMSGYGRGADVPYPAVVDPAPVALFIVVYNGLIFALLGVPWRQPPTVPLLAFDWAIASLAIVLTGGFVSPFLILYYALAIGAALRVGLSKSLLLVGGCALVYSALSMAGSGPVGAVALPALVVQVTSLTMVVVTAVGMKRVVEVEARRVELEERAASQLRILNDLMNTVLSASPDLERVMRTVATASSRAVQADSGLTVLFRGGIVSPASLPDALDSENLLLVSHPNPFPIRLSDREQELLAEAVRTQGAVLVDDAPGQSPGEPNPLPGLAAPGGRVRAAACVPFRLEQGVLGALFVGRHVA
jgi:uncharacterized coiled-coil protein SlyX